MQKELMIRKPSLLRNRLRRGQAMVEYSVISHALMVGGAFAAWPFLSALMNSLTKYYQSIYFVLTSSLL